MKDYFSNIIALMNEKTIAYIDFTDADEKKQTSPLTWLYPANLLLEKLSDMGVNVEVIKLVQSDVSNLYPETHTILKVIKRDASLPLAAAS